MSRASIRCDAVTLKLAPVRVEYFLCTRTTSRSCQPGPVVRSPCERRAVRTAGTTYLGNPLMARSRARSSLRGRPRSTFADLADGHGGIVDYLLSLAAETAVSDNCQTALLHKVSKYDRRRAGLMKGPAVVCRNRRRRIREGKGGRVAHDRTRCAWLALA